jgi:hypothetical protein
MVKDQTTWVKTDDGDINSEEGVKGVGGGNELLMVMVIRVTSKTMLMSLICCVSSTTDTLF